MFSVLTEMYVPGRKHSVTKVMTFIDVVSSLVFRATSFMSSVMYSIWIVVTLLIRVF